MGIRHEKGCKGGMGKGWQGVREGEGEVRVTAP